MRLILVIFSVFFCTQTGAADRPQTIEIDPQDQLCAVDADCAIVQTKCNSIDCECGEPVNIEKLEHYKMLLDECRPGKNEPVAICDFYCPTPHVKCAEGKCVLTAKVADSGYCNEVKSISDCIGSDVKVRGTLDPQPFVEAETALPVLKSDGSFVELYGKHTLITQEEGSFRLYMPETIDCLGSVEVTGRFDRETCPEGVKCDGRAKIVVQEWECLGR